MALKSHHFAWLLAHPNRTPEWLAEHLLDGFHVHHLDCNHANDDPKNLALVEGSDHMRMHGMPVTNLNRIIGKIGAAKTAEVKRQRRAARLKRREAARHAANIRWSRFRAANSQCLETRFAED